MSIYFRNAGWVCPDELFGPDMNELGFRTCMRVCVCMYA